MMFVGIAGAYPSGAPFRLVALPANIELDWKGLPGTNTLAYLVIHKLQRKIDCEQETETERKGVNLLVLSIVS
jgi:hypothetical protein